LNYEVHIPLFDGPFDLLLFFIERDELDIHEVSLAAITGDFLDYIHKMTSLNLELASEFIWVAATLMKIKARQLLPRPKLEPEMGDMHSEENLMLRLLEYKRFKGLIPYFTTREEERSQNYSRGNLAEDHKRIYSLNLETNPLEELQNLSLFHLLSSYKRVMERNQKKVESRPHSIDIIPFTIENQKKQILEWINISKLIDFHLIEKNSQNKLQLVYSFLAILELVQEQILNLQVGLGANNFWVSSYKPVD
jgi:segregation and condensation protein A